MSRVLTAFALSSLSLVPFSARPLDRPIYAYNRYNVSAFVRGEHPVESYLRARRAAGFTISLIVAECEGSATGTNVTTDAVDATGADAAVVHVTENHDDPPVVTDSSSATWNTGFERASFPDLNEYYATIASPGSSHTVTATIAAFPAACVQFFSGFHATPRDQSAQADAGTTCTGGSITPTADDAVVTAAEAFADDPTIDGGFSTPLGVNTNQDGTHYALYVSRLIQSTAAAANPEWAGGGFGGSGQCSNTSWLTATGGGGSGARPGQIVNLPLKGGGRR